MTSGREPEIAAANESDLRYSVAAGVAGHAKPEVSPHRKGYT